MSVTEKTIVERYSTGGELSTTYWEALADSRLLIPRCNACSTYFFTPRRWCPVCWSDDVEFTTSAGTGSIFAISELHTAFQGVSAEELPVPVVMVELDEGVRVAGRLAKDYMPAAVGDRVVMRFAADPATSLPQFVTVASDDEAS